MLKRAFFVLGIMFFLFPVFAQESSDDVSFISDDDPYLSIEDQEALLDKEADEIIDATVIVEYYQNIEPLADLYLVRIEVYSRMKTAYIPVGNLSLETGFFSWNHDGRKQNGYAVFMYPVKKNASRITRKPGVKLLYGKSFGSAEEAIAEIQTRGSKFNRLIRYRPVVDQMVKLLENEPYQGDSR